MNQASPRKFTGYHMIAVMVLFFGTIITVNMIMAYNATQSWTGLVVKNSYVASQQFNEVTAEKEAQLALGWKAIPTYERGELQIALTDKDKEALTNAIIVAKVGRPAFESEDHMLQMAELENGTYGAATDLGPGVWDADVKVTGAKGEIWTRKLRFRVGG
ncbi:MAG: FixH family protein [Pseudomonadota bacterium]